MALPDSSRAPAARDSAPGLREGLPSARVLRQFRIVFNAVKTHFQQVERHAGLGGAQVWALSVIADADGLGVKDLAAAMDVHQSTASNLVKGLVQRGLVEAVREGSDRRAVQLRVLPQARSVLARVPGPYAGVLPKALARLEPATLARLEADLDALIAVLDPDHPGDNVPLGL